MLASHWICGKDFHLGFPNVTTLFGHWLFHSCTAYLKIDAIPGGPMSRILIGLTAIKHSLWTLRWKQAISFLLPEMFGFFGGFFLFFILVFLFFNAAHIRYNSSIYGSVLWCFILWETGNREMKGSAAKSLQSGMEHTTLMALPESYWWSSVRRNGV